MIPRGERPAVLAIVGATATGKSALALVCAEAFGGEVVSCDSTAVYRRFDIGTDKVPPGDRRGIPHHLIDVVEPTATYSAADYAREAAAAIDAIAARGALPIVAGGTGFYYRALVRGLFPGPARNDAVRRRLAAIAARRGPPFLHRMLARVDREAAARVQPRDLKRVVRALEVYFLTGRTLTAHFADTRSPLAAYDVVTLALRIPPDETARRVAARVDRQFARGVVAEVRAILAAGVPATAHPFTGLVYRQILEYLDGVRDETATRDLIALENRRYARRQLIWFRKEPNLQWLDTPGDDAATLEAAREALRKRGIRR